MVQRKIEELNQTICKIKKDHKKDLEETLMPYKVDLEQAKENHNKASNEVDRLASENKKLREELQEYSLAFNPEVEASSTLWSKWLSTASLRDMFDGTATASESADGSDASESGYDATYEHHLPSSTVGSWLFFVHVPPGPMEETGGRANQAPGPPDHW